MSAVIPASPTQVFTPGEHKTMLENSQLRVALAHIFDARDSGDSCTLYAAIELVRSMVKL